LSYEIDKKQGQITLLEKDQELRAVELKRQKAIRNGTIGFGVLLLVLAGGLFNRYQYTKRTKKIIEKEHERSETLLLNILPAAVAEELKTKGEAEAVHIDHVTVLFTDFKGFTAMSELVTPKQLVKDLHECFSYFDGICGKYGLEKIKTIGDAYMAAGGVPVENGTHAADAVRVALAMRDFIAEGKARKIAAGLPYFEIRIGIHTGPVVAGIVGVKKFQYDIWGDTVNTASRMESSGEPGHVNISEATYALVNKEPGLVFTPRGKVKAKGKGELEMFFVERDPKDPSALADAYVPAAALNKGRGLSVPESVPPRCAELFVPFARLKCEGAIKCRRN
jgi:class 3 adenylate cyclase